MTRSQPGVVLVLAWKSIHGSVPSGEVVKLAWPGPWTVDVRVKTGPGDFVQLWRHDGSGHSVIFLDWVRDGEALVGLRYWSTQTTTNGIGEAVERFGTEGRAIDRAAFHLCRPGL